MVLKLRSMLLSQAIEGLHRPSEMSVDMGSLFSHCLGQPGQTVNNQFAVIMPYYSAAKWDVN
jgi:hypothetical protein